MQDFLNNHIYNIPMSRWLLAALFAWIACLIMFAIYMMLDAPTIDEESNEQEYRSRYWDDPEDKE